MYFQILRGRVQVFFQPRNLIFFQMACVYLLNSRDGPQSLDFVITTYSYPLLLRPIWINLNLFAPILTHLDQFGPHMDLIEPILTYLDLFVPFGLI